MKTANIFDIQRCSMVDGPGIRTTVFFKGCNLRCAWCHNPESQSARPEMMFYENKCTHCGRCLEVCPHHLKDCELCGRCADLCPNSAREICGKSMDAAQIMDIVRRDRAYYEFSGGGVTFSGGECLLQAEALCELLSLCRGEGINTAVDTAGDVDWRVIEGVLPWTEWFLYDVKCWDEETHRRFTGVSNAQILDNLRHLASICPEKIIVRVPVIPTVNTSEAEMTAISRFLKEHGLAERAELLPYHKMGEHKYDNLGRSREVFQVPDEAVMNRFRAMMT